MSWRQWTGGARPVDADARVIVRFESGVESFSPAGAITYDWNRYGASSDITEYRVIEESTESNAARHCAGVIKKLNAMDRKASPTPPHYSKGVITKEMVGLKLDPALIAEVYPMSPMRFTILKKDLRCGDGNKTYTEDLHDIISAAKRELELVAFREGGE